MPVSAKPLLGHHIQMIEVLCEWRLFNLQDGRQKPFARLQVFCCQVPYACSAGSYELHVDKTVAKDHVYFKRL